VTDIGGNIPVKTDRLDQAPVMPELGDKQEIH